MLRPFLLFPPTSIFANFGLRSSKVESQIMNTGTKKMGMVECPKKKTKRERERGEIRVSDGREKKGVMVGS